MSDLLLVHVVVHGEDVGLHDVGHLQAAIGGEQVAEGDHPEQPLLLVEHVTVVNRFEALAPLLAKVGDRLVDGHVGAESGETGAHQAAGVVLGVGEQRGHLATRARIEQVEQTRALLPLDLLHHVGGVVRVEQTHPQALLGAGDAEDDRRLGPRRQAEEEVVGLATLEEQERLDPFFAGEHRPDLAKVIGRDAALAFLDQPHAHLRANPVRPSAWKVLRRRARRKCGAPAIDAVGCRVRIAAVRRRGERHPAEDRRDQRKTPSTRATAPTVSRAALEAVRRCRRCLRPRKSRTCEPIFS